MVYIRRDEAGGIVALSTVPPHDGAEAQWQQADPRDPEVAAFADGMAGKVSAAPVRSPAGRPVSLKRAGAAENGCALGVDETDIALIRVIEDLIDTLIDRGLIRFTDLPIAAQTKLTERRTWRSSMREAPLLDDDEHAI